MESWHILRKIDVYKAKEPCISLRYADIISPCSKNVILVRFLNREI